MRQPWKRFDGPTAIAKAMIANGAKDNAILAETKAAIKGAKAARTKWPHLFTRTDLKRLRARLAKKARKARDA